MTVVNFSSAAELAKYVTDSAIAQAVIVAIVESDGQWYLFHY